MLENETHWINDKNHSHFTSLDFICKMRPRLFAPQIVISGTTASASRESWFEMENLGPKLDLLNQNPHFQKIPT